MSNAPGTSRRHKITTRSRTTSGGAEPLSSIVARTLVIHGSADPMFPIEHAQALAAEFSEAKLLRLKGAGHGVARADWQTIVRAILKHTGGLTTMGL